MVITETNHAALGRGLKLYTDAMRRLVKERLFAVFKGHWWDYGVLEAMTTPQRSSLTRDVIWPRTRALTESTCSTPITSFAS